MTEELSNQAIPVPEGEIPDEFTPAPPPPYPGRYVGRLPSNLDDPKMYEEFDVFLDEKGFVDPTGTKETHGDPWKPGSKGTGKRVSVTFDDEHPLEITRAPQGHEDEIGKTPRIRLNNRERNRARKNQAKVLVADTTYLLRALGCPTIPGNNAQVRELLKQYAGKEVQFDLEWNTNCSETRTAYWVTEDEHGTQTTVPMTDEAGQEKKGCGARYYLQQWTKDAQGNYVQELTCACGAVLRPFAQIRNFKSPTGS